MTRLFSIPSCGLILLLLASCGDDAAPSALPGCADDGTCSTSPPLQIGGTRPAMVQLPQDYDTEKRYPLIVSLHGFGASGLLQATYFGLTSSVDSKQFVLVMPDGTLNEQNQANSRFWNGTPACCAAGREVDDVGYLTDLIAEARNTYSIDAGRVYLFGHSNGGFMSFRMACEASEIFTALVSLAGSTFNTETECAPATQPVSVLAIHGDMDATIPYDGRPDLYPAATETAERFAVRAGCDTTFAEPANIDILNSAEAAGAETSIRNYNNCDPGMSVSLWTIANGPHIPLPWTDAFSDLTTDWLLSHNR